MRGELGLSPKAAEGAKRVLDVGTGTGIWAIEYGMANVFVCLGAAMMLTFPFPADQYPESEVRYNKTPLNIRFPV